MKPETKRKNNIIWYMIFAVLFVLSVIGVQKTVYIGADIDESYALTMALRIINGDHLMTDMWEPHQMSAVLYAPLAGLYRSFSASSEGILVFMRFCGVFIQAIISIFMYVTLRKEMPAGWAMVLSFAYFNFTPKHIQSPEFTVIFYWAVMGLMLFLFRYFRGEGKGWLVAAGVCTSIIVLCYPAAVLVFLFVMIWLLRKGSEKKDSLWYMFTCIGCGILFLVYIFLVSGGEAFSNIPFILMDEAHDMSFVLRLKEHLLGLWDMLKLPAAMMVLCHVGRPVFAKKKNGDCIFFTILLALLAAYFVYQFHTLEKVNFIIFYPIVLQLFAVQWYAYATFPKDETDKMLFRVSLPINALAVVVIMFTSNVPTSYSMSFLMPGVLLGSWQILRIYKKAESRRLCLVPIVLCICVLTQLLAARICLVRYTSTQRKNIFEPYYEVTQGVLKGVHLGEFDYSQHDIKAKLFEQYVEDGDTFLYVGCDMFLYSRSEKVVPATGNTISTPAFGEQLIAYYEKHPDKIPTVIFVDREYGMDFSPALLSEPMRSFMEEYFDIENTVVETAVTVYQRER